MGETGKVTRLLVSATNFSILDCPMLISLAEAQRRKERRIFVSPQFCESFCEGCPNFFVFLFLKFRFWECT
ncbi:MAG: hypothetical protein DRI57_13990 [Deltaproteobacteria bacterium]|nr:MAG: hypothetical protein DRI57_13990 [Deltaproteobacteria bacterium]